MVRVRELYVYPVRPAWTNTLFQPRKLPAGGGGSPSSRDGRRDADER